MEGEFTHPAKQILLTRIASACGTSTGLCLPKTKTYISGVHTLQINPHVLIITVFFSDETKKLFKVHVTETGKKGGDCRKKWVPPVITEEAVIPIEEEEDQGNGLVGVPPTGNH